MLSIRDKVALSTIVISIAGLGYIYNSYQNIDKEVLQCVNTKTQEINKIIEGYPEISNPVFKNRIDKQYNLKMDLLKQIKSSPIDKQRELCELKGFKYEHYI